MSRFSTILPLLMSLPASSESRESSTTKPSRYLIAKGLPTLPMRTVEKAWNREYVDMEEFLPAPRSLRLAEQARPAMSLQESLVGALNQFQATQQQKGPRVMDVLTWVRCFSLYMAVMAKKAVEMIPCMVAHLHTVLRLHQRATYKSAWLEYDIQFRMEMAASDERSWTSGDPWQYVSCLPGPSSGADPFDVTELGEQPERESGHQTAYQRRATDENIDARSFAGKGKRPLDSAPSIGSRATKPTTKKARHGGLCRLFNTAPGGCPYGKECIFTHLCTNCGARNEHGRLSCPFPLRPT